MYFLANHSHFTAPSQPMESVVTLANSHLNSPIQSGESMEYHPNNLSGPGGNPDNIHSYVDLVVPMFQVGLGDQKDYDISNNPNSPDSPDSPSDDDDNPSVPTQVPKPHSPGR